MSKRPFAVFDVDGTIVRTSLFLQIVDQLVADNCLPLDSKVKLDAKLERYRTRQHATAFNDYTQEAVVILFGNLTNIKVKDYKAAVDKVIGRTWKHTYIYSRNLIKNLKEQDYFLMALSGSEGYAVKQFTQHYGFDLAIGETYEQQRGVFTGKIQTVVHGKGKFLKHLVAEHDLAYKDSYAIGDSKSDAAMLELVERPIAFNPEQQLLNVATEHSWPIVIERKNVIYKLGSKNGKYFLA